MVGKPSFPEYWVTAGSYNGFRHSNRCGGLWTGTNLSDKGRIWRAAFFIMVLSNRMELAAAKPLSMLPVGKFSFSDSAPTGLSGLTFAGGNQYYAVEDSGARVYPLTINIDLTTGAVNSATFGPLIQLGGTDLEGIAYNGVNNSLYVSDEAGPSIREYSLAGNPIGTVVIPTIYNSIRTNLSLESISLQAGHQALWTANEQALTVDGDTSTTSSGTTVRLQKFSTDLAPAGQWAYETDTINNSFPADVAGEQVGVSDILALPNGKLLVLERQADANFLSLRYKNRIYEVNFSGATDVSSLSGLSGGGYTGVTKKLLWDSPWFEGTDRDNFEGMTLGPQLTGGDYSVLLISDGDDSGGFVHGESLYALRLGGGVTLPADFDTDGDTDGADFLHWQRQLGDALNLVLWQANFGTTMGLSASTTAIPEPTTALLVGLAMIGLAGTRQQGTWRASQW